MLHLTFFFFKSKRVWFSYVKCGESTEIFLRKVQCGIDPRTLVSTPKKTSAIIFYLTGWSQILSQYINLIDGWYKKTLTFKIRYII